MLSSWKMNKKGYYWYVLIYRLSILDNWSYIGCFCNTLPPITTRGSNQIATRKRIKHQIQIWIYYVLVCIKKNTPHCTVSLSLSVSVCLSLSLYIYIFIYISVCIYMYEICPLSFPGSEWHLSSVRGLACWLITYKDVLIGTPRHSHTWDLASILATNLSLLRHVSAMFAQIATKWTGFFSTGCLGNYKGNTNLLHIWPFVRGINSTVNFKCVSFVNLSYFENLWRLKWRISPASSSIHRYNISYKSSKDHCDYIK